VEDISEKLSTDFVEVCPSDFSVMGPVERSGYLKHLGECFVAIFCRACVENGSDSRGKFRRRILTKFSIYILIAGKTFCVVFLLLFANIRMIRSPKSWSLCLEYGIMLNNKIYLHTYLHRDD